MVESLQTTPDEAVKKFLHLCLRGRWDSTALQAAQALTTHSDLDWHDLHQVAQTESLAPLLYQIVRDRNIIPAPVEQQLRDAYYHNACRNTFLLRELGDVLHHMAKEGVDVILLKGAALAEGVYGDIAVRPMSDLDLLIQQPDLPIARRVLAALGYMPSYLEMHAGFNIEFRNEEPLYKPGLIDTYIDLHWKLISPSYYQRVLPTDWFWETALPTQVGSAPALVLGHEAQVLYLSAHLLHHGGRGILWLHDVAEVLTSYQVQIDWEQILLRSQAYNLVLSVQQVLTQVADRWHAPIPANVLEQLRVLQPSHHEAQVFTWLTNKHSTVAQLFFTDLVGIPNWLHKLYFAWSTLFPTRAYMQHRYHVPHPVLVPLYYPYRWLRWKRIPSAQP
jgi:hypothetical protein